MTHQLLFSAAGPRVWNYLPTGQVSEWVRCNEHPTHNRSFWGRTSGPDSRTCHTAVSDSRWRHFYLVSGTKAQCESPFDCALEKLVLTYWQVLNTWRIDKWMNDFKFPWQWQRITHITHNKQCQHSTISYTATTDQMFSDSVHVHTCIQGGPKK